MGLNQIPAAVRNSYEIHEWRHAAAVLATDFSEEFNNIIDILGDFRLKSSFILVGGGNKGPIANDLDAKLMTKGWIPKTFDVKILLDGTPIESPTHEIDCFKNGIGLEIEWNNKDTFFDRDLNNFRLLFELRAISVGIIITRSTHLHEITFKSFPAEVRKKYAASTTHMEKLLHKLNGGGGGGCPILAIGIGENRWEQDIPLEQMSAIFERVKEVKRLNKGKKPKDRIIPDKLRKLNDLDLSAMLGLVKELEETEE